MSDDKQIVDQNGQDTGLTFANYSGTVIQKTEEERKQENERLDKLSKLKGEDLEKGKVMSTKYWDASIGDTLIGVYDGFKPIVSEDKSLVAIQITTKDGKFLAAGQHLVEAFLGNSIVAGSAVYVKHTEMSGRMKMFEVRILEDQ